MGLKWACSCWTHGITKFTYALSNNDKQCWTLPFFSPSFFHSDPLSKINSILFLFLSSFFLLKTLTWQWLCSEEEAVFNLQQFIHFFSFFIYWLLRKTAMSIVLKIQGIRKMLSSNSCKITSKTTLRMEGMWKNWQKYIYAVWCKMPS